MFGIRESAVSDGARGGGEQATAAAYAHDFASYLRAATGGKISVDHIARVAPQAWRVYMRNEKFQPSVMCFVLEFRRYATGDGDVPPSMPICREG